LFTSHFSPKSRHPLLPAFSTFLPINNRHFHPAFPQPITLLDLLVYKQQALLLGFPTAYNPFETFLSLNNRHFYLASHSL
jgi:hypothetical protein